MADTDTDLIARVYPFVGPSGRSRTYATKAIAIEENKSRFIPAQLSDPILQPKKRRERGSTEPLEQQENALLSYPQRDGLELRFSHGPLTQHGFVFGCDPDSDIVLPSYSAVSFHHFAVTFDTQYRPIVRDLGLLNRTEVTYNEQGKGRRSNFKWIVSRHRIPRNTASIVINVTEPLKFQIVVTHHDITDAYIDNVNRFREGRTNARKLVRSARF